MTILSAAQDARCLGLPFLAGSMTQNRTALSPCAVIYTVHPGICIQGRVNACDFTKGLIETR